MITSIASDCSEATADRRLHRRARSSANGALPRFRVGRGWRFYNRAQVKSSRKTGSASYQLWHFSVGCARTECSSALQRGRVAGREPDNSSGCPHDDFARSRIVATSSLNHSCLHRRYQDVPAAIRRIASCAKHALGNLTLNVRRPVRLPISSRARCCFITAGGVSGARGCVHEARPQTAVRSVCCSSRAHGDSLQQDRGEYGREQQRCLSSVLVFGHC